MATTMTIPGSEMLGRNRFSSSGSGIYFSRSAAALEVWRPGRNPAAELLDTANTDDGCRSNERVSGGGGGSWRGTEEQAGFARYCTTVPILGHLSRRGEPKTRLLQHNSAGERDGGDGDGWEWRQVRR